jgi:hypothetical protein
MNGQRSNEQIARMAVIGGGGAIIVGLVLPWFGSDGFSVSGFEANRRTDIALALLGVVAAALGAISLRDPQNRAALPIAGLAGALGVGLMLRLPLEGLGGPSVGALPSPAIPLGDYAIGYWLSLLGAVAIVAGGVVATLAWASGPGAPDGASTPGSAAARAEAGLSDTMQGAIFLVVGVIMLVLFGGPPQLVGGALQGILILGGLALTIVGIVRLVRGRRGAGEQS